MGRRIAVHPRHRFHRVLAGGLVAGVLGSILLAAPVLGTLRVLLTYVYAKLLDQEPFPDIGRAQERVIRELEPGKIDAILFDLDGTLVETDDAAVSDLARRCGRSGGSSPRAIRLGLPAAAHGRRGSGKQPGVAVGPAWRLDDNLFGPGRTVSGAPWPVCPSRFPGS